jgi:hypothetical protein
MWNQVKQEQLNMTLTKKQVKALLDVISADTSRPVLCTAYIRRSGDGQTYLVATDGYVLTKLYSPGLAAHEGKFLKRESLIRWTKLAGTKDVLADEEIIEMLTNDDVGSFPATDPLLENLTPTGQTVFNVNPKYLVTMEQLADTALQWTVHGGTNPYIARSDKNVYVVMPLKS